MANSIRLVFVHLGTRLPKILEANLSWCLSRHPTAEIHLVTDATHLTRIPVGVKIHLLKNVSRIREIDKSPHSTNFRQGYWLHTIRRIIALEEWHLENPEGPFLHVESDMLLLPDFPFDWTFGRQKLTWPRVNARADMPGLLYSPNLGETLWLAQELVSLIGSDPSYTDMTALSKISKSNPGRVSFFPTTPEHIDDALVGLNPKLEGIFDAAQIGIWLTGEDPSNHWGVIKRFRYAHDEVIMDPRKYSFSSVGSSLILTEARRDFLVFTLHVHSKSTYLFSSKRFEQRLSQILRVRRPKFLNWHLSMTGFWQSFTQLIRAGKARLSELP